MTLCQTCRCPLPAGAPEGICPACLMTLAQRPPESGESPGDVRSLEELRGKIPGIEWIELVGRGGMGAVYRARQTDLNREVAVKVLPESLSRDPAFLERFRREAQAMAQLDHPNIVTVYGSGVSDGIAFIIMEYVVGTTLRDAIRAGAVDPESALKIIPKICDALAYAHARGIVHRDIKPENILLGTAGRVNVLDFGLAKVRATESSEWMLTETGTRLGTLRYMAPEQLDGGAVDHRADIYSLGVVFYEMLTGQLPMGRFEMPSERTEVDPRIDEVVLRTLCRNPSGRYQKASELETDVERISRSRPVRGGCQTARRGRGWQSQPAMGPRYPSREWKSAATLFGWPVVHIAFGHDPETGEKLVAKGIVAIGDVAIGGLAFGGASVGLVSVGGTAFGLNAFGGLAVALQWAVGGASIGGLAFGGAAAGGLAMGGAASGLVAVGGAARGHVAIGDGASGNYVLSHDGLWNPRSVLGTPVAEWFSLEPMWASAAAVVLVLVGLLGPLMLVALAAAVGLSRGGRDNGRGEKMPRMAKSLLWQTLFGATLLVVISPLAVGIPVYAVQRIGRAALVKTVEAEQFDEQERAAGEVGAISEAASPSSACEVVATIGIHAPYRSTCCPFPVRSPDGPRPASTW